VTIKQVFVSLTLLFSVVAIAQEKTKDSVVLKDDATIVIDETLINRTIDPLAPSRAAFYSAILPGLGQAYNKKYWKIPIVYGAIGTGIYFYKRNNDNYDRYRTAFKRRKAGFTDDEFYDINGSGIEPGNPDVSDDALQDGQEFYQRNRDLSLLITIGLYVLNIIDANVDAHLKQFNVNDNLSFQPYLYQNEINSRVNYGFSITFDF
jgi:hypothetical protein